MSNNASIKNITGRGIVIKGDDIDTDQIIPARFMKVITFEGIEEYAFYDVRYTEDGTKKQHPFNDERYKGASIMVVNSNFGCGSSREHAPQTLMRSGINAIIGESFAEIFAGNCAVLGVPVITLSKDNITAIQDIVQQTPQTELAIDLEKSLITIGDKEFAASIPPSFRHSFISGLWNTTNILLKNIDKVQDTYTHLPYINKFNV